MCLSSGDKLSLRVESIELLGPGLEAMAAALEHAGEHEKAAVLRGAASKG